MFIVPLFGTEIIVVKFKKERKKFVLFCLSVHLYCCSR